MLDTTFQLLADRPATIVGFALGAYVLYKATRVFARQILGLGILAVVLGAGSMFVVFFLAEFTGDPLFQDLAEELVELETVAVELLFGALDAYFAAVMLTVLKIVQGIFAVLTDFVGSSFPVLSEYFSVGLQALGSLLRGLPALVGDVVGSGLPVLSGQKFVLSVFAVNYLAGVVLMYLSYGGARVSRREVLMRGVGVALFAAGIVSALITVNAGFSGSTWRLAMIVNTFGALFGVLSIVLIVTPKDSARISGVGSGDDAESGAASQDYRDIVNDTLSSLRMGDDEN